MMQGRKKKRDTQLEELENESQFLKSKSMLEYQNKCLCTMIDQLESKLEEKSKYVNQIEKRVGSLTEIFTTISLEIYNLNETVDKLMTQNKIESRSQDNLPAVEMLSNIVKDIQSNSTICLNSMTIHDHLKSLMDNISTNVMNLINNVITTAKYQMEVKNDIEKRLYENLEEKVMSEYENTKSRNEELQRNYMTLFESNKNSQKEFQLLKAKSSLLEENLKKKEIRIEELENINFNLNRRINTHPSLPYIKYEKKMFLKMVDTHTCVCHICGLESLNTETKQIDETQMNVDETSPVEKTSETVNKLTLENESLKERLRILYEEYQHYKIESALTEDELINSKPFKILLNQTESLVNVIDSLKEVNTELNRQKSEFIKEKENEIRHVESKFNEKLTEMEYRLVDLTSTIEKDKIIISDLNLKLINTENLLKSKNIQDINSIFGNYEKEKENFIRQMKLLRIQLSEYERKFDEEFKRNKFLEEQIENFNVGKIEDKDMASIVDKRLSKKPDQIKKLEAELKSEKEYKEIYISELEVNEQGLNEINKKLKSLTTQLLDSNEKIARMTNDKMKDIETIKRLNDEKDIIENRLKLLDDRIKLEADLKLKTQNESTILKELMHKLESEIKMKEEDSENLKNEIVKLNKIIEQYKTSYEKSLSLIKELENVCSKHARDLDQVKSEYKQLCKFKNLDNPQMNQSITEMKNEIDGLNEQMLKYSWMVNCNVCKERKKDTIITKCFHMLCKECIDETCKSRNRICPICKTKIIGVSDLHSIYWD